MLHFLSGQDVFVSLPTGAGKSLCYLLLPTCFDLLRGCSAGTSMVIVVSPLKGLMEDQVAKARSRGLSSISYVGTRYGELQEDMGGICKGAFSIVFVSPQALLTELRWREVLRSDIYQRNMVGLIVDEAHCVDKW